MFKRLSKKNLTVALLYAIGFIFLISVSPDSLPVWALVLPFIYAFVVVYLTAKMLSEGASSLSTHKQVISISLATTVTLILVLGSLHQLNSKDILIAFGITVVLVFYLRRLG